MPRTSAFAASVLACMAIHVGSGELASAAKAQAAPTFEAQVAQYDAEFRAAKSVQDYVGAHKPCLDKRDSELLGESTRLERRIGELVAEEERLGPLIVTQTSAYQGHLATLEAERKTLAPLIADEAAWNKKNQAYLSQKDACARALKGDYFAALQCRAGALAPGNRSFEAPLAAARQRLATAQASVDLANTNLAASRAALTQAQAEAASTRTGIEQTGAQIGRIKADLSAVSTLNYEAQSLFQDFEAELTAARKIDRTDERPRTLRVLSSYTEKVKVTTQKGRAFVKTAGITLGEAGLRACGLL